MLGADLGSHDGDVNTDEYEMWAQDEWVLASLGRALVGHLGAALRFGGSPWFEFTPQARDLIEVLAAEPPTI